MSPRTYLVLLFHTIMYIITVMCFKFPFDVYKCGKCPECLQEKRREWSIRLQLHTFFSGVTPYFCHLTYDNKHVPINDYGELTLSKRDVQLFIKRLRTNLNYYYEDSEKPSIKYYISGEYGPNGSHRPHYHCIIFGLPKTLSEDEARAFISKAWQNGDVRKRSCWLKDYAQLHYVTKYMINFNDDLYNNKEPPFRLCSSGLGQPFIDYAIKHNLYDISIQRKFKPTRIYLDKLNHKHAVSWKGERPLIFDEGNNIMIVNPIISNFRDFIEFQSFVHGRPKIYRYPLPRYFAEKLYTEDFRIALGEVKKFRFMESNREYFFENYQYDKINKIPMWLQLKRYLWSKQKKTKKDKNLRKNNFDILND